MPRLIAATDYRYYRAADGSLHCPSGAHAYPFWRRYLEVFDEVVVVMRLFKEPCAVWAPLEGPGVSHAAVPAYEGPSGLLMHTPGVLRALRGLLRPDDIVVARAPGTLGVLLTELSALRGRPFGVEVLSDPNAVFTQDSIVHPAVALFREGYTRSLRRQCRTAAAVAYVTGSALQRVYPPGRRTFALQCSDVELGGEAIVLSPRSFSAPLQLPRLVTVGSLSQLYKGTEVLLRAIRRLRDAGMPVQLDIVGDGLYRQRFEALRTALGLDECVDFSGLVPAGAGVRAHLDAADVFVMPSLTEGLPRAMLEAMARGMPCVGSAVGGIPELLAPGCLVEPGDEAELSSALLALLRDPERLARCGAENLERARGFSEAPRRARHGAFLGHLRSAGRVQRGWW